MSESDERCFARVLANSGKLWIIVRWFDIGEDDRTIFKQGQAECKPGRQRNVAAVHHLKHGAHGRSDIRISFVSLSGLLFSESLNSTTTLL